MSSNAAIKAWATRNANAKKRSNAAKKAWATRKANEAKKLRRHLGHARRLNAELNKCIAQYKVLKSNRKGG